MPLALGSCCCLIGFFFCCKDTTLYLFVQENRQLFYVYTFIFLSFYANIHKTHSNCNLRDCKMKGKHTNNKNTCSTQHQQHHTGKDHNQHTPGQLNQGTHQRSRSGPTKQHTHHRRNTREHTQERTRPHTTRKAGQKTTNTKEQRKKERRKEQHTTTRQKTTQEGRNARQKERNTRQKERRGNKNAFCFGGVRGEGLEGVRLARLTSSEREKTTLNALFSGT